MAEPTDLATNADAPGETQPPPNRNRRRLLQGGLGAAPLLTLVSRPVLGQGSGTCSTPSGFVSLPTSEPRSAVTCIGRAPGYWKQTQHFDQWPRPYYPGTRSRGKDKEKDDDDERRATRFNAVFSPSPYAPATTLLEVLELHGGPPNDVGRHIVAALLNVAKGWAPVLTPTTVPGIWREYASKGGGMGGYFEPTAGVKWYHDDIVRYLVSTMPL